MEEGGVERMGDYLSMFWLYELGVRSYLVILFVYMRVYAGKVYKGGEREGWVQPSIYRALDTVSPYQFTTPTTTLLWDL